MDWIQITSQLGFPISIVAGLAYGAREVCRYLAPHVVDAIKEHTEFVRVATETQKSIRPDISSIKTDIGEIREDVNDLRNGCIYGAAATKQGTHA